MDEAGLIQDAQRGDLEAFNRLILAYQDRVYNQAFRVLGEYQSADDATQEAFISAYKSIRSFRGGSFRAWLLRIVTNACYDELRRKKRRPTTPLEPVDDEGDEIESPNWIADSGELPEPSCARYEGGDVWFETTVPLSGELTVETIDVGGITNTGMAIP